MARRELPPSKAETVDMGSGEPWRCTACSLFVYNVRWLDGGFYPVGGAPPSQYISKFFPKVCNVCYDMFHCLINNEKGSDKDYWKHVQDEANTKIRKLRSGSDYLTS
jgi:hypothetical protein